MIRGLAGSTPIASAGPVSVTRLIQRIIVAVSGNASASRRQRVGRQAAATTPRNKTSTSPRLVANK